MIRVIVFTALSLIMWPLSANADNETCAKDKRVVDSCYNVHGRLALYANMRPYLYPIGTKRLLGIVEKSNIDFDYYWPKEIEKVLDYDMNVYGDFRVCPFTQDKPGKMRFVCIDSAKNIKARPNALHK